MLTAINNDSTVLTQSDEIADRLRREAERVASKAKLNKAQAQMAMPERRWKAQASIPSEPR